MEITNGASPSPILASNNGSNISVLPVLSTVVTTTLSNVPTTSVATLLRSHSEVPYISPSNDLGVVAAFFAAPYRPPLDILAAIIDTFSIETSQGVISDAKRKPFTHDMDDRAGRVLTDISLLHREYLPSTASIQSMQEMHAESSSLPSTIIASKFEMESSKDIISIEAPVITMCPFIPVHHTLRSLCDGMLLLFYSFFRVIAAVHSIFIIISTDMDQLSAHLNLTFPIVSDVS